MLLFAPVSINNAHCFTSSDDNKWCSPCPCPKLKAPGCAYHKYIRPHMDDTCDEGCIKTRRLVGLLHHLFSTYSSPNTLVKLYISFIRPHLEYAIAIWDPYLIKDVTELEDIQKFALRVCMYQVLEYQL